MKKTVAVIILVICFQSMSHPETNSQLIMKTIFSLSPGISMEICGKTGYSFLFHCANFFSDSPFYFAFRNFNSSLPDYRFHNDYGIVLGYNQNLFLPFIGVDLFVGPVFGGTVDLVNMKYTEETIGIQAGIGLCLFYNNDIDIGINLAPVVRFYNPESKSFDMSRSYIIFSISVNFKNLIYYQPGHWKDGINQKKY